MEKDDKPDNVIKLVHSKPKEEKSTGIVVACICSSIHFHLRSDGVIECCQCNRALPWKWVNK